MQLSSEGMITVIVKPNAKKTELLGYDEARQAYKIAVKAPPEGGKANSELLRFIKKETGKAAVIVRGKTNRTKQVRLG
ncbi:MAG: DUF167 domain-containing protein [Nanoarchaeota archaeon]